jgi:predicted amidophosphoribosyltransferase
MGMGWWILVAGTLFLVLLAVLPRGRSLMVRHLTTRRCPGCFERFSRKRRSCPVCRTRVDDFGGAPPPPNPMS